MHKTQNIFIEGVRDNNIVFDSLLDIGAYKGKFAEFVVAEFGLDKSQCYLVEPNPDLDLSEWKHFRGALSDSSGKKTYHKTIGITDIIKGMGSILWRNINWIGVQVDTITGAELVKMSGLKKFVIKVDVEGYAYQVLKGFGDTLKDAVCIIVEVEDKKIWSEQMLKADVDQYLMDMGFEKKIEQETIKNQYDQFWIKKIE
jgi:FkbM family methyltransferase